MSSTSSIVFESVFRAPIVRAQFDVLLVLADAMAPSLADLYDVAPSNWNSVVTAAAEALATQTPKVKSIADAISIWDRVLNDLGVANLTPAAIQVLSSITERLKLRVAGSTGGESRLEESRKAAVDWIRALGNRRGLTDLANAVEYRIRVHYDAKGDDYCASSSLIENEIGWSLQLVERALYAALILEMLFEHEYLSHMLPRNLYLSKNVREIWLSAALYWEFVNHSGDRSSKHVQEFLWEKFRRELNMHFDPKNQAFFGPWKIDKLAERIYFSSPEIFWDITGAILECSDCRQNADTVDLFFKRLLLLNSAELRAALMLEPAAWPMLQDFHRSLI
ncbi:hypothetical protein [Granulicella arctica]|uniref:hypothetical protein n=1 Tax=Granulicella arctica TaxID=940613 RepID=UPI0021E00931|nr:hypothetical protein [Granulicella arctica]